MEFAFLDESGTLGCTKDSKYLVLTLLCTRKIKRVTKIVRDIKKRLLDKNKCARWLNSNNGEIKFYNFPDKSILKTMLRKLAKVELYVYFIALEKGSTKLHKDVKPFILTKLFEHIYSESSGKLPEKIVADLNFFNHKKVNYFVLQKYHKRPFVDIDKDGNEHKNHKVEIIFSKLSEEEYKKNKSKICEQTLIIEHINSRQSELLQVVDIFSGIIFNHMEYDNTEYMKLIDKSEKIKLSGTIIKSPDIGRK